MSDGEVEVEAPQGYAVLPKEVTQEIGSTKLFNKWSYEDVEIRDISLTCVYNLLDMLFPETKLTVGSYVATTSRSGNQCTCHTPLAGTL